MEVVTPVSQSYITRLWNNDIFQNSKHKEQSFIHPWSRYFTYILLFIALLTGIYWNIQDPTKLWPAVTAVLIVACPCSLLLSSTFTYGNMLSILGKSKFYLKNAGVIESLDKIDTVVMDKTGTLSHHNSATAEYEGKPLSDYEKQLIKAITGQSIHPLSKIISRSLHTEKSAVFHFDNFCEIVGNGLVATVNNETVKIGSFAFIDHQNLEADHRFIRKDGATVYISINDEAVGHFLINNDYREGTKQLAEKLTESDYDMVVLSGDNDHEKNRLQEIFGTTAAFYFNKSPQQKLDYIRQLKTEGKNVLMLGDGLNDAGALRQADVGIAVSDNANLFSPASDAILDGSQVHTLGNIMRFARTGKNIVTGQLYPVYSL
jgi:Cu+-exporting ATPase